jgi:hypothetical protein
MSNQRPWRWQITHTLGEHFVRKGVGSMIEWLP